MTTPVRDTYAALDADHRARAEEARGRSVAMSTVRVVTFLALAAALVLFDVLEGTAEAWALGAAGLLTVVFFAEVGIHRRIRREQGWHEALAGLAAEGVLRLDRRWEALAEAMPSGEAAELAVDPGHPYARDLDVTGRASLVRLAGPVTSERGRRILRSWLLEPADPGAAVRRQGAVTELAAALGTRHEFAAHGRLEAPDRLDGLDAFLAWAEGDTWFLDRPGLRVAAWVLPALLISLLLADLLGGMGPWWLLVVLPQLEVFRRVTRRAQEEFGKAAAGGGPLRAYVPQLALVEEADARSELLVELRDTWREGGSAHRELERLSGLLDTIESRRNMVYASLAPVLLLDAHLGARLDRWRRGHGTRVRRWLDALGTWEALSALAAVAHDHPDWVVPEFVEGSPVIGASDLGHPLLPPGQCVRNDVQVGPPGGFLLVTGSNMSGKSTLLRAVGANAVLAAAGAPVCATRFSLPPVHIHTSMRIDDSLAEGISLFMAELLRVRGIVQAASDAREHGRTVLYLLDEILHGTNTAERRVAARGVVRHLLEAGAIGAVSTHDLTLAEAPDLARVARAVHFREQVHQEAGGTRLTFDHTLRDGIATTRNALKLLEAVGLGGLDLDEADLEE
ncbi:MAG: hypothetical protein RJQ04_13280 [Longimicrobiales bacterium]